MPNLLPRWWIGSFYKPGYKVEQFKKHRKSKIRVGIVSSGSHYNNAGFRIKEDGQAVMTVDGKKWFDESGCQVSYEEV